MERRYCGKTTEAVDRDERMEDARLNQTELIKFRRLKDNIALFVSIERSQEDEEYEINSNSI